MIPPWGRALVRTLTRRGLSPMALALVGLCTLPAASRSAEADPRPASPRPNILIILADDMGFSDAGCYGGEIATLHLDRLAAGGLRFTQFYNTGRCWPSRAALLTGRYPQEIRMDPPRGRLPVWSRLLPHYLQPLGYRSYHSGKWHMQGAPRVLADGGFDRSYRLEDHDRNFHPTNHWLDDVRQPPVPRGSNYYTTVAFTDFILRCLADHHRDFREKPFFAYLAYTAPHFPLQAPAEDIARYRDRYRAGWDVVRRARHARQKALGIVTGNLSPPEPPIVPHWNMKPDALKEQIGPGEVARALPWDQLSAVEQRFQAEKMAIHAAMIDRMDREIGRVLNALESMGALTNTLVLFASDNGASAEFLNRGDRHNPTAAPGSGDSFLCLGPGWSTVANTPFRLHKSWVHEGGIATPFIAFWPRGISARGELRPSPAHLIDLVPTLLSLLGVNPAETAKPTLAPAPPFPGSNLLPALTAHQMISRDYLFFHHEMNRALRIGDWKIVSRRPQTNEFALYDLSRDRIEQHDLSREQPERAASMARRWQELEAEFRRRAGP
jgi:arylsulfatase A-like enzyme